MVIGKGLISTSFKNYENNNNFVIFASGVSNSKEEREEEFLREKKLLSEIWKLNKNKILIYFSTCSIFDEDSKNSKYVSHKKEMEEIIKEKFEKFIIFRLPNIISWSKNKNTSFNFFKNKIKSDEIIFCKKNAYRYFIDIEDIKNTIPFFLEDSKFLNKSINVCFNNKIKVKTFILELSKILTKNPIINIIDGGSNYKVNNKIFLEEIHKNKYKIDKDYNKKIIKKYIKNEDPFCDIL